MQLQYKFTRLNKNADKLESLLNNIYVHLLQYLCYI